MGYDKANLHDVLKVLLLMWRAGDLGTDKLIKMLRQAIEREADKPEEQRNAAFIKQCEDMLWEIQGGDVYYGKGVKSWFIKAKRLFNTSKPVFALNLALVLTVCLCVVNVLTPKRSISTFVTPDEQMYVVQGTKNGNELMPSAMAALGKEEYLNKSTMDFKEVSDFFGFVPPVPQYVPSGWTFLQYEAGMSQTQWRFSMAFTNENEEHILTYSITGGTAEDIFNVSYHQNGKGTIIKLPNGFDGYQSYNIDDILISWVDGLNYYDICGPIKTEEALQMIYSI